MNNFAEIIEVQRFRKVIFYTLSINGGDPLFIQFRDTHNVKNKEKFSHIFSWIKLIGNKYGADTQYFRNEAKTADAGALPPKGVDREPGYVEYNEEAETYENKPNNLRLYCLRANRSVVFLFNGDIKLADKAKDCDNVRGHFKLANKLSELINNAFREKNIRWINDDAEIEVDDDFLLEWE
ncbi:hypothetical protein H1R16_01400 [Marnyiella aurantia]|uniref:Uncharacterized protein n=1 Tax=Marnyiella aurantia TaxID=2758037 RepID=A0A7D7LQS7_9FLAO|nr:hypothetical protein [Marnyiella aurantia]MBA5245907.1 hypothetical protein [Marnyiella aurantia]QMS98694.1 hypothetical protein H1R16_01400 [Marnyiella aurantia]